MVMRSTHARMHASCAGRTHTGRVRKENQDQFLIAELAKTLRVEETSLRLEGDLGGAFSRPQATVLLVADGMGGMAAGDRASAVAVRTMAEHLLEATPWAGATDEVHTDVAVHRALEEAVQHCRAEVQADAARVPDRKGMGTTLTMAYLLGQRLHLVHVGDSRCYLLRDGDLTQLTRDHTVAHQLVESGVLEPEKEEQSPYRHVLWNVVDGDRARTNPDIRALDVEADDMVLLCTDGLTRHVTDQRITEILQQYKNPALAAEALIDEANEGGGTDNIAVIVARVQGKDA